MSVYKSEKPEYLERAFQSVWIDQTMKPDQIVLIEDGPLAQNLHRIISKWQQQLGDKLTIIVNEENLGLTKSLNKGIKKITGELIARMDSDDVSHPLRFERQVNFLIAHPDVAIIGGAIQEFNDNNECLNIRHYPLDNQEVLKYIYKASPLAHPAVMMRKAMFDNGLSYNEHYRTTQDIALWFDVLCSGYKISNLKDVVLYFRRNDSIFKRRSRKKAVNEFIIYTHGIYHLFGMFSWKYIYPIMRFGFRLLPQFLIKRIYSGRIRKSVLEK